MQMNHYLNEDENNINNKENNINKINNLQNGEEEDDE